MCFGMETSIFYFAAFFLLSFHKLQYFTDAKVEFTNVQCIPLHKSFATFDYCFIKAVNRTYKYFSMRVKLLSKLPITNVTVNFSLLKRANGYKPFLYNITFDACKYLRTRKNPLIKYFHGLFEGYSNMNHTCPFGPDDLIVEKLPISHFQNYVSNILPLPTGKYMFYSLWSALGTERAKVLFHWESI